MLPVYVYEMFNSGISMTLRGRGHGDLKVFGKVFTIAGYGTGCFNSGDKTKVVWPTFRTWINFEAEFIAHFGVQ